MPQKEPRDPAYQLWEYHTQLLSLVSPESISLELNTLGAEGWELCAQRTIGFAREIFIFKRVVFKPA